MGIDRKDTQMRNQRTKELRIYRHRARRRNKWRNEMPHHCSNPLPLHNSNERAVPLIIKCEKELIRQWEANTERRLWRMEESFALKLFSRNNMTAVRQFVETPNAH
jgi:hypothetical protein